MKKENPEVAQDPESPSAPQKTDKAKKEKKEKKPKVVEHEQLPVLVEFTYTVSAIFLIFVGVSMAIISLLTGASLLNLVLRTSVALLVIGTLLVLISSQVSSGLLQASLVEQEEHQKAQTEEANTPESPLVPENPELVEA